jgi:hypothetical protein
MSKLIKTAESQKTLYGITVGSRVTFQGNLPGGFHDNYSGYSKVGAMYGTVIKINKKTSEVQDRIGNVYLVDNVDLNNIENLF